MKRLLIALILCLFAFPAIASGPGIFMMAAQKSGPPTTPVISAAGGNTTVTVTLVSGDVGFVTNILYWDTTSHPGSAGTEYLSYANSIISSTLVTAGFPGTPYVHTGRTNGTTYYYRLRGTDIAGSTQSNETAAAAAAVPVILNFENGTNYLTDSRGLIWTATAESGGDSEVATRSTTAHSGTYSIVCELNDGGYGIEIASSSEHNITIAAGGTLTVWAKATNASNSNTINILIDGIGHSLHDGNFTSLPNTWTQYTYTFVSGDAGSRQISVVTEDAFGGSLSPIYIDDIIIQGY